LGTVYFLAFFVLGTGFSFGAQILIARRNGEKEFAKTGEICYAGGFFLLLLALILTAGIKFLSPVFMPSMVQSPEICKAAIEYLDWRAYGIIFAFGAAIFRAFYVGIAQTRILTFSSVAMVLANIVLNYGLIFGKYGLPEMGIAGAALASSISEAIALGCYVFYTLKYVDLKKYGFRHFSALFDPGILKKVFSVSCWMMLQPFLAVGVWFFFFIAVEHLGERSLAAINLARALSTLPFIIVHAFATAANSLVSNLIGEGRSSQVWRLVKKLLLCALIFVTPLLLFFALFPELSLRIYTDNVDLIKASVNVTYVMCVASFIQIIAFVLFNAVSGTGAIKATFAIEFIDLIFYTIFVWLIIFKLRPSPAVAWSVEIMYQIIKLMLSFSVLFFGKWQSKKL
jgi:putative MATE family efflux protein